VSHAGIGQSRKIAALAEAYHLPLCPHSPNSPLSNIVSGNVCASIPNFVALEFIRAYAYPDRHVEQDMMPFSPWMDKIMNPSLSKLVKDGYLQLPDGPGWGVEMNEEEILKHPYVDPNKWLADSKGRETNPH
jgi:galactonate dehydratase